MGILLLLAALAGAWALATQGPRLVALLVVVALSAATQAQATRLHARISERGRAVERDRIDNGTDLWATPSREDRRLLQSSLRVALLRAQLRCLAPDQVR